MNNEKLRAISDYLKGVLNLSDHVDLEMADKNIRGSILFRGPNVYILAFAIVIASVGLNVNSIPVIIGAMLVSPLMGPIFGATLGFGTNDMKLIISSLKNLGLMVGISIVASTFYFVLTPLDLQNPTELLARTNPTVYDVLIALFGGAAGMLETARKEKGTVLSGVAIATALMPPLCTVGFGIATLNWHYTLGALYLFCINCVFISLAGFLVVKLLRFPVIRLADPRLERRRRWAIGILLLLILVPSIVSAISVIQNNKRDIAVSHFIDEHKTMGNSYIYDHKTLISGKWLRKETTVEIYMAGESLAADQRSRLIDEAEQLGFTLTIKDGATSQFLSERELVNMIYEQNEQQLRSKDEQIRNLSDSLSFYSSRQLPSSQLAREICTQFPSVTQASFARAETVETAAAGASTASGAAGADRASGAGASTASGAAGADRASGAAGAGAGKAAGAAKAVREEIIVIIKSETELSPEERAKLQNWLKVRLNSENLRLICQ